MSKGDPGGQARDCSTDPAAQAGTEVGLAAQGGGWRGGTSRDRSALSSHSSPPAERRQPQRSSGHSLLLPPSHKDDTDRSTTHLHREEHTWGQKTRGRDWHLLRNRACTCGHTQRNTYPARPTPPPQSHLLVAVGMHTTQSRTHTGTVIAEVPTHVWEQVIDTHTQPITHSHTHTAPALTF